MESRLSDLRASPSLRLLLAFPKHLLLLRGKQGQSDLGTEGVGEVQGDGVTAQYKFPKWNLICCGVPQRGPVALSLFPFLVMKASRRS